MLQHHLTLTSAALAFYFALATFPAIALLASLLRTFLDSRQMASQLGDIRPIFPPDMYDILVRQLNYIADEQRPQGLVSTVALLVSLWSAAKATRTLMDALNFIYDTRETRGFVKRTLVIVAITLTGMMGAALAFTTVFVVPEIDLILRLGELARHFVLIGRWVVLGLETMILLAFIYRFGPGVNKAGGFLIGWGSSIGTLLWVGASIGFSYYISHFKNYNQAYGGIGSAVAAMLWLLLSSYIVLLGAEIDATLTGPALKSRRAATN